MVVIEWSPSWFNRNPTKSLNVAPTDASNHPWTIEGFARYWSRPQNPAIIAAMVWPDIVGYWPRCYGPLEGRAAYIEGIANFLGRFPVFPHKFATTLSMATLFLFTVPRLETRQWARSKFMVLIGFCCAMVLWRKTVSIPVTRFLSIRPEQRYWVSRLVLSINL